MSTELQFAQMNNADAFLNLSSAPIDFNLAGGNILVSGVPKKRILCFSVKFVTEQPTILQWFDGPSTTLSGPETYKAGGACVLDLRIVPWYQTSPGNDLVLNSTEEVQVSGTIYYRVN